MAGMPSIPAYKKRNIEAGLTAACHPHSGCMSYQVFEIIIILFVVQGYSLDYRNSRIWKEKHISGLIDAI